MKKVLFYIILFAHILIFFPIGMNAQKVSASIDTNAIRIGEQLTYTIVAECSAGMSVVFPPLHDSIGGGIEVVQFQGIDTSNKPIYKSRYLLTVFDSGQYQIPSLPVVFLKRGVADNTLMTDSITFQVYTVQVDTTRAIKDIKPILSAPLTFSEILPYLSIVFGILLLTALLLYYLWRRKQNKPFLPLIKKTVLPPWTIALEKFNAIEKNKLWQNGRIKEYHSEVSDTLRQYIENQLNVNAMEMVSADIVSGLHEIDLDRALTEKVERVLTIADLVKFAKEQPLPDENAEVLTKAREFVLATKPHDDNLKNKSVETGNETTK